MTAQDQVKPYEAIPVASLIDVDEYMRGKPAFLARMAMKHGPIFAINWQHGRAIYMVGPEANRFVLHTHRDHFSHDLGWTPLVGELFGHGLLNMDGEEHDRQRKMMNPAFTIAYMERYLPIMGRIIAERTADWPERPWVDLYAEARKITFDVAAEALVGLRTGAEVDQLRQWFYTLLYADFDPATESEESFANGVLSVRDTLNRVLLPMIAERRVAVAGSEPNDVLSILTQARDEHGQPLSDTQLLAQTHILLVAGHETSTSLAAWLLYLLATHPDYLARVHEELAETLPDPDAPVSLEAIRSMRLLGNAVTETGRLQPPVAIAPRGVVEPFSFAGYQVPVGARVYYSPAGSHRLPSTFAEPERFDPDRFAPPREEDKQTPYALVPFGGGPRICIGVNFATVEIKALAAHILSRYTLEPLPGQDVVQYYYGVTGTLPDGIKVRVRRRQS